MSDSYRGLSTHQRLIAKRIGVIGTEEAFSLGALIAEVESAGHRVIKANLGQPDFPLPAHVAEAVIGAIRAGKTTYCDPQGLPELRKAIAVSVGANRGLDIDPERVVVYPGGRPPIGFAQHAYVEPGDEVVYPTPSYPLFESFIDYVHATPVPVPLLEENGFSLSGEGLAPYLTPQTKLVFINFPSNPTGGVATAAQLAEIGEVIKAKAHPDVRIYSDEAYEAIVFDGEQHVSIASLPGMEEMTIIATGASKTYSWTGGRVGWGVYPTVFEAKIMRRLNINYFASIPPYNQIGAKVALESPESPPAIAEMVEAFERRRDIVVAGLNDIDGVTCQNPKGAFYVFPNVGGALEKMGVIEAYAGLDPGVKAHTSPATLFQLFLLYRYQTATMDRRSFGIRGSEGQHFLRLSIATGEDDLREAMDRIATASKDAEGFGDYLRSGGRLTL
ncbi:MAG: aminotransferase class I/II-fold pyridoxal phosphate-dependent enzyme [Acidimicrobiia bacterium]|nr:aminotransferase class I/II-fold pyridoxal phosphate-dependent enzyme [Acidimicrobiia bacterium]